MYQPFLGDIRIFAGTYAPENWAFCAGQYMSISKYQTLFALIGATYGGDGITNFALPDMRGRIPVGTGPAPGDKTYTRGEKGGEESNTLVAANMPAHQHNVHVGNNYEAGIPPENAFLGSAPPSALAYADYGDGTDLVQLAPDTVTTTPEPDTIYNIQPSLCLNYIICINGLWPPQP